LHHTTTHTGRYPGQRRYFFSQRAEQALEQVPVGFVLGGEVPVTGVPVLRKTGVARLALSPAGPAPPLSRREPLGTALLPGTRSAGHGR
jgi:hypothetical protein